MTMPVSVSVSSAAPATGKATAVSTPHGTSKGVDGSAADGSGVAEMFAALVATLTAQMQPVTEETPSAHGTGEGEGGEAVADLLSGIAPVEAFLTTPVLVPGVPVDGAAGEAPGAPVVAGVSVAAAPAPNVTPVATAPAPIGATALATDVTAPATQPATTDAAVGPTAGADAQAVDAPAGMDQPVSQTAAGDAGGTADDSATPAPPRTTLAPSDAAATDDATTRSVLPGAPPPGAHAAAAVAPAPQAVPVDAPTPDAAGVPVLNVAGPAGPARTEAPAPVVAPPPVADAHVQVARVVRPLRLSTDGAYELALDLTPAELGRVRIDVELRGSTISLSLRADNPATRELLAGSLAQLRSELESAGLHAGNLDVGGRGTDGRGAPGQDRRPADGTTTVTDEAAAAPAAFADSLTDDSVDVRA